MKLSNKKITLILVATILAFSGACGADKDKKFKLGENGARIAKIPKFNKIQIINEIKDKDYEVEIYVNESVPDPEIKSMEARTKKPGTPIAFPGEVWVSSLRLVLKDKEDIIDSGEQLVEWAGPRAKNAEILNIFGEKLEGVDVIMEIKKDTLIITVKKAVEAKREADSQESKGESKRVMF